MSDNQISDLPTATAELLEAARAAATKAYNPYSRFAVGAAIRTATGKIFTGCNIENASYSVTLCAERVAGSQAILAGETNWEEIVVVSPTRVSMCGTCRQFCFEFAPKMRVWAGYLASNASKEGAVEAKQPQLLGPVEMQTLLPSGMTLDKTE